MKPRWTESHPRVNNLIAKAKELTERIEKNEATEGSQIGPTHLEIETGGRIAHRPQYWTNQSTIEVDDVANKGATTEGDPGKMMDAPPHQYGPSGSTLSSHEGGGEGTSAALKKSDDKVLGSLSGGDSLRLRKVADMTESLARQLN